MLKNFRVVFLANFPPAPIAIRQTLPLKPGPSTLPALAVVAEGGLEAGECRAAAHGLERDGSVLGRGAGDLPAAASPPARDAVNCLARCLAYEPAEVLEVTSGAEPAGMLGASELDVADPPPELDVADPPPEFDVAQPPPESVPPVVSAPPLVPAPPGVEFPDPIKMASPSDWLESPEVPGPVDVPDPDELAFPLEVPDPVDPDDPVDVPDPVELSDPVEPPDPVGAPDPSELDEPALGLGVALASLDPLEPPELPDPPEPTRGVDPLDPTDPAAFPEPPGPTGPPGPPDPGKSGGALPGDAFDAPSDAFAAASVQVDEQTGPGAVVGLVETSLEPAGM